MSRVLILRPEPGAGATAARARALGLEPVVAPIFTVGPVAWDAPDPSAFDALLLTSANAARHAGPALGRYRGLPCYTVGEATAEATAGRGFDDIRTGPSDGAALLELAVAEGRRRLLHLAGRNHVGLAHPEAGIERRIVYSAAPEPALPEAAREAIAAGALALLHSPRAARHFARLAGEARELIAVAAISKAAATAAGWGWRSVAVAEAPRDEALLALAARLCQTERRGAV